MNLSARDDDYYVDIGLVPVRGGRVGIFSPKSGVTPDALAILAAGEIVRRNRASERRVRYQLAFPVPPSPTKTSLKVGICCSAMLLE
jgi:hypothetical protein